MTQQMSEHEFQLFRDLIHRECGMSFGENKKTFLSIRIGKRVAARNLSSYYGYYRYLKQTGVEGRNELLLLLDALTINETGFFRNRPQFKLFEEVVLPELVAVATAARRQSLRIWSAGCATGEEPYSIAMSVLEVLQHPKPWKIEIFASDLSLSALGKASRGVYPERRVKDIDPDRVERYFLPSGDGHTIGEVVKRLVIFDFHNLMHDNGLRDMDVIFCRNVLIYFHPEEQAKVLSRFIRALRPGGYLFLGHSESVLGLTEDLKFVHQDKGTAYRKVEAA
jgi:chemotaxis protein methyltransferase CheR